jgi:hypothetical protein
MKYVAIICLIASLGVPKTQVTQQRLSENGQTLPILDSTTNWKIYPLTDFNRIWRMPMDSLKYLKSRPLNNDSMHAFLVDVKDLQGKKPMWMGCYLTSCQTPDGQVRKVLISHYAGFLYCEWDKSYLLLDSSQLKSWLEYLSNAYVSIEPDSNTQ